MEHGLTVALLMQWKPGTAGALELLVKFLENVLPTCGHDKAKLDRKSSSRLSPHIHFGEISVRLAS